MPSTIFCYSANGGKLKEYIENNENGSGYDRFTIALKACPDKPLHTIITNGYGCGRFVYDEARGTYRQMLGTMQYCIPQSEQGIRRALRGELREALEHKRDCTVDGLNDEECQILAVLEGE